MRTRVQKWGNSLALRLPRAMAVEAGLVRETPVDVTLQDGSIVITPAVEPKYTLDGLLAEMTTANVHREVDTGSAVGREAW
ncbi:MAG: AbrB/MazE/SpoVT family DNA-binding domain-containing protein [Dehalococcoidia bacterium]|jgi:antitoxin MazE|nr:AbrB/MazE/SpoVT family DNA-binding domain-containing protein [Dehalococcoidia bacterium]